MPKMTDRERLAKIEADRRKLDEEADTVRQSLRAQYAAHISQIAVEQLSEREFRDLLTHAIRVGGAAAITALKALPITAAIPQTSPERRPSDEHGGAARRRPTLPPSAASPGDGAGSWPAP